MAAHLGDHLTGAIREILSQELQDIRGHGDRLDALEERARSSSAALARSQEDAAGLRGELDRQRALLDSMAAQLRAEQAALAASLQARLDRHESDTEGPGGLRQLRDKVESATAAVALHQKVVWEAKTRTDDFGTQMQDIKEQCDQAMAHCRATSERMSIVEEGHAAVGARQEAVEDSVASKYSSLWQDVTRSLEAVKSRQESAHREMLADRQREEKRTAGRNSINYVTKMVATVHDEKRRLAVSKDLLSLWREQTWASQRRRTGLNLLCGAIQRRQRQAVARWSHATSLDTLARRLREEYDAKLEARLPDVPAVLAALGLPAQCERLGREVEALQREKCSKEELNQVRAHSTAELGRHAGLLQEATSCHGALAQKVDASLADSLQKASGFAEQVARLEEQLAGCERQLSEKLGECEQTLAGCATSTEVKDLLKDVCRLWSSIKQLDAAKADRKDVDLLGIEKMTSCKETSSKASLDDIQGQLQERCGSLDQKVEQHERQCQHWQSMWENLTGSVETLVAKVASMQTPRRDLDLAAPPTEEDTEAPPPAKPLPPAGHCPEGRGRQAARTGEDGLPGASSRESGRTSAAPLSRPHSASRSRADLPPHSFRSRSLDRPAPRPALPPEKGDTLRPTFTSSTGLEPILSTSRLDSGRGATPPWKRALPARSAAPQPVFARPRPPALAPARR